MKKKVLILVSLALLFTMLFNNVPAHAESINVSNDVSALELNQLIDSTNCFWQIRSTALRKIKNPAAEDKKDPLPSTSTHTILFSDETEKEQGDANNGPKVSYQNSAQI